MKGKLLFSAALLAGLLASCSSEEVVNPASNGDAIGYGVTSGFTTRSANSYCNTNLPGSFTVAARYADNSGYYFQGETVTGQGDPRVWNPEHMYYWPDQDLRFIAYADDANTYKLDADGNPMFENFVVENDCAKQLDLLYAVKNTPGQRQGQVKLNFRHALSQIVFKAVNSTTNLDITVSGVGVSSLWNKGSYEFPVVDTDPNVTEHGDNANATIENANDATRGTWTLDKSGAKVNYFVQTPETVLSNEASDLTVVNHKGGVDSSLILMPQSQEAWVPGQAGERGFYFVLKVKFVDRTLNKTIYDGEAWIPATIDWKQGIRYVYTFNFANGTSGGFTPEPDPRPIISSITYDVTTDDFIPVEGGVNPDQNVEQKTSTVTLDNGADATPATQVLTGYGIGANIQVKLPTAAPVREGYDFNGWTDAEGNNYGLGTYVTLPAGESTTLTASWTEQAPKEITYKIVFTGNRPETDKVYGMPENITFTSTEKEVTITLPMDMPRTDGSVFWGWSEDYKATKDEATLEGKPYTLKADKPEIVLYAVWADGVHAQGTITITPGVDPTD